jgi:hypothetical protein
MKYFNNLTAVESEIIRMDSLRSLLNVLAEGADTSNQEDIENCLWQAKDMASSINENLTEEFQNLFDAVREDTFKPWTEYDFKPLSDVVDSWIRNK